MPSIPPLPYTRPSHPKRLAGYPPFSDEITEYSLKNQITNARYTFPEKYWKRVSESAKDLVKNLLTLDPKSRITVSEALSHPWLQDEEVVEKAEKLMAVSLPMLPPSIPTPANVRTGGGCMQNPSGHVVLFSRVHTEPSIWIEYV
jgi:serine/threonine protein kinase